MRIYMFAYNPLINDARVFREAATLAHDGHTVTVIGAMRKGLERTEQRGGFTILRLPFRRNLRRQLRRWWRRRLPTVLRRRLNPRPPTARRRFLHRWLVIRHFWLQAADIATESPAEVYHAHDLNTLPAAARAARRAGGCLVYDSHELFSERVVVGRLDKPIWTLIERFLIKRADSVITVNDFIAAELGRRYNIAKPTVLLNCPAVPTNFRNDPNRLRALAGLAASDEPIILFQGQIQRDRGLEFLIAAAELIDQAKVVFIGDGPLMGALRGLVSSNGLEGRVRFVGAVPQEDLLSYTVGGKIGVVPAAGTALNSYLTSPNKLFEYIAAGLPVVVTRMPVLEQIVREYEVGLICEPRDPEGMAAAINVLLNDDPLYERLRENAIAASRILNWEHESRKLLDVYRGLPCAS